MVKLQGKFTAIVPAAGNSIRYGKPKLLEKIDGTSVITHSVKPFLRLGLKVIIALPIENRLAEIIKNTLERELGSKLKPVKFTVGGEVRVKSVYNALLEADTEYVLIHDAARPLVNSELIIRIAGELMKGNVAVIPVLKPADTTRYLDLSGEILYLDRNRVLLAQTPQGFVREELLKALKGLQLRGSEEITDEGIAMQIAGYQLKFVEGDRLNIKLTFPEDIVAIRAYSKLLYQKV